MKNFLIRLLLFFAPLALISYPLDLLFSHYLSQSHSRPGEFEVWKDIYTSNAHCDIAIYGSSRAMVHFNPKIMSDSLQSRGYNFGMDGHNFWLQYLRHLKLLKYNPKPKMIILAVDIYSLIKRKELYEMDQFLPIMLWDSEVWEYTKGYEGYDKYDYLFPLVRYIGKKEAMAQVWKNIRQPSHEKHRFNGFYGDEGEWNSDFDNAKASIGAYSIEVDSGSVELFEAFIKECRNNEIELVFVYTPEYIEGQYFVTNRADIMSYYTHVSSENNVDFYDFSNDSICFSKLYFYNANHLNKRGADIFTRKLTTILKERKNNRDKLSD